MKFTPKRAPSAAEQRLADAQAARADAEAEMQRHQAVINRLDRQIRAVAQAEAALARFDADQSAKLGTWAQTGEAEAPQADWQQRERLERELSAARAAAGAMSGPRAATAAAGQRAAQAARQIWIAAKLVSIEEAAETLEPLRAAIKGIYEAKRRVDAAREGVLRDLRHEDGDVGEVFQALAQFDNRRREAESIPMSEIKMPDGIVPDAQQTLASAMAQLGRVGPAWDVGAPAQADARVGLFVR
jgi:hypothetical protein